MAKSEITIANFSDNTNLKNDESCIIVMILDNCSKCKNYMAALDSNNINYYFLKCNKNNMDVIIRISAKLGLKSLAVPVVLKYKNGVLINKCSNNINDINDVKNL